MVNESSVLEESPKKMETTAVEHKVMKNVSELEFKLRKAKD